MDGGGVGGTGVDGGVVGLEVDVNIAQEEKGGNQMMKRRVWIGSRD